MILCWGLMGSERLLNAAKTDLYQARKRCDESILKLVEEFNKLATAAKMLSNSFDNFKDVEIQYPTG